MTTRNGDSAQLIENLSWSQMSQYNLPLKYYAESKIKSMNDCHVTQQNNCCDWQLHAGH